jgi:hypothetical protein
MSTFDHSDTFARPERGFPVNDHGDVLWDLPLSTGAEANPTLLPANIAQTTLPKQGLVCFGMVSSST